MRILTVRQPWAWAIIHGGKDVENRVRNIAGNYRGPVAIHVAQRWAGGLYSLALQSPPLHAAIKAAGAMDDIEAFNSLELDVMQDQQFGHIIGVVDLVAAHVTCPPVYDPERGLCSPWAEPDVWHLRLSNPRPLADPIPYKGALGLRTLVEATAIRVWEAIAS